MSTISRTERANVNANKVPQGRAQKYFGMYVGFVKDNVDSNKMGRLRVWIPEFGSDPADETGWFTVGYCSPFAGATNPKNNGTGQNRVADYNETQTSYGMWMAPPDLENQVAIMFANGDASKGFWFGCIWQQFMNHMVPGIAGSPNNYDTNGTSLPVGEYNKNTVEKVNDSTINRPASPLANALRSQGLINDPIRGVSTSSARRESPSQVYGILTPGPTIEGTRNRRTGGNQFIMDDATGSEHILLRTRSGAQVRIDETNDMIYIINKSGTAWIELDTNGNIDVFGAGSGSLRFQQDFNIRADRDVNIEAGRNINIKATKGYSSATGSGGAIGGDKQGAGGDINIQSNNNINVQSDQGTFLTQLSGGLNNTSSTGIFLQTNGIYNLTASGGISTATGGVYGLSASGDLICVGSTIQLNGPAAPTPAMPVLATPPTTSAQDNVLGTFTSPGSRATQGGVQSVVSRMPTYEPSPVHKK